MSDVLHEAPGEFRFDDRGQLDDIVVRGVDVVHLERMDRSTWWMGFYQGETIVHLWMASDGRELSISVEREDEADDCPEMTDDRVVIRDLVQRFTARDLAEELLRRCGCTFDPRLPDGAPPVFECDYHRQLREGGRHDQPRRPNAEH